MVIHTIHEPGNYQSWIFVLSKMFVWMNKYNCFSFYLQSFILSMTFYKKYAKIIIRYKCRIIHGDSSNLFVTSFIIFWYSAACAIFYSCSFLVLYRQIPELRAQSYWILASWLSPQPLKYMSPEISVINNDQLLMLYTRKYPHHAGCPIWPCVNECLRDIVERLSLYIFH